MVKIEAVGQEGEPVLVLGFTREDLEVLIGGQVLSQDMRSRTGLEATIMVMVAEDERIIDQLRVNGRAYRVGYKGRMIDALRGDAHG
jgi:hypothetical protein